MSPAEEPPVATTTLPIAVTGSTGSNNNNSSSSNVSNNDSNTSTPIAARPVHHSLHPGLSPSRINTNHYHHPMSPVSLAHTRGGYMRQHIPGMTMMSSPTAGQGGGGPRSRSRSLGNPPLGWSPQRVGPLSPTALLSSSSSSGGRGGGIPTNGKMPGLPDIMGAFSLPPEPPIISESQRAMEAAVQKERQRAKDMEKQEIDLSAEELRTVLKRERHRMARLAADLASMRSMAVQSVAQAEVHEEGRINHLMRRLDSLQAEKGRIIVELEREEEMLTNNLQKKLNEVRREKAQLEHMSRADLEARLAALKEGAGDINMSEALEEKEMEEEEE